VRAKAKVAINSLWKAYYEKSIGTKMNDLDLCLEVVSKSRKPLPYVELNISKTVDMIGSKGLPIAK